MAPQRPVPTSVPSKLLRVALRILMTLTMLVLGPFGLLMTALSWLRLRYVWLKPRPGDIYVATATKAGTTWMQQLVYQLVTQGRGEFDHITQVSPFLEHLIGKPTGERILDALPSPRIIKTHVNHSYLRPTADSRIIYVTRDASDTLVSRYHHMCMIRGVRLDFDGFVRDAMRHDEWSSHLASWWPHRNDPNVLHVRYEDMISDRESILRRVAGFLGIPLEEERLADILEKTSFDYMKRNDLRFDPRTTLYESGSAGDGFIRKGKVGSAREALKPEQHAALEAKLSKLQRKLGISGSQV